MSDENASKPNGLGVDPMERLASFKPPRDYSLGVPKSNKKIFTPNLNVTRNRNKGSSSNSSRDQKKEDKNKKERKIDRNKNFKTGSNVIKSSGVFSEGIGSGERHSRGSYVREGSVSSTHSLQRPTIRVKDAVRIDKELEEQRIKKVMCSLGENEENEDFKTSNDIEAPITLPMDDIGWTKSRNKQVQVKKEVIAKTEPEDVVDAGSEAASPSLTRPVGVKTEGFDDTYVVDLLSNDDPTLMLIKFPDTLPGRGCASDDDSPPRRRPGVEPTTSSGIKDENVKDDKCYLKDLEEGRIGKLLVRRSGRVTLRLGDTCFQVSLGTKSSFYQEVVSVGAEPSSRSARLISLGPLQHKLTVTPQWDTLFLDLPS